MKIARVAIKAADYRKSFEFYHDILGLKLISSWQRKDSWGALLAAGPAVIEVIWYPSGDDLEDCNFQIPRKKISVEFEVHDIDILFNRLSGLPVKIVRQPYDTSWGFRAFSILDPDGIVVTFLQPIG